MRKMRDGSHFRRYRAHRPRCFTARQAVAIRATRLGRQFVGARDVVDVASDGAYAGGAEELTPLRDDWISVVPLAMTALALLAKPGLAATMAKRGWGAHLLDVGTVREIERADFR